MYSDRATAIDMRKNDSMSDSPVQEPWHTRRSVLALAGSVRALILVERTHTQSDAAKRRGNELANELAHNPPATNPRAWGPTPVQTEGPPFLVEHLNRT